MKWAEPQGELQVCVDAQLEESLSVRPGAVVSLFLRARAVGNWAGIVSSAPTLALPTGWRVDPDGTAYAAVRCAGARGGKADITVTTQAPDPAGPAPVAFILRLSVVPRRKEL